MQVLFSATNRDGAPINVMGSGQPSNRPSTFVFALPKTGSVMQDKIVEELCKRHSIVSCSPAKSAFNAGHPEDSYDPQSITPLLHRAGYCFYGFRRYPTYMDAYPIKTHRRTLLVRDPRDMMVSLYFSMKHSHPIPKEGVLAKSMSASREALQSTTIDAYVLDKAPEVNGSFMNYQHSLAGHGLTVFRYEDVVFAKEDWVLQIAKALDIPNVTHQEAKEVASPHNVFPDEEKPDSHIRRVTPGDHRNKLRPDTISKLNRIFDRVLGLYGYEN